MTPERVNAFFNQRAGPGIGERQKERLTRVFEKNDWVLTIGEIPEIEKIIKQLQEESILVVGGGDGTLSKASVELAGSGRKNPFLPIGLSGNSLAENNWGVKRFSATNLEAIIKHIKNQLQQETLGSRTVRLGKLQVGQWQTHFAWGLSTGGAAKVMERDEQLRTTEALKRKRLAGATPTGDLPYLLSLLDLRTRDEKRLHSSFLRDITLKSEEKKIEIPYPYVSLLAITLYHFYGGVKLPHTRETEKEEPLLHLLLMGGDNPSQALSRTLLAYGLARFNLLDQVPSLAPKTVSAEQFSLESGEPLSLEIDGTPVISGIFTRAPKEIYGLIAQLGQEIRIVSR
ncbi:MAG: diacylglycerol kinase family protein [Patescibacteria group bacterium]|nr:hypothetical protein [Patescibacteria group bacterium]